MSYVAWILFNAMQNRQEQAYELAIDETVDGGFYVQMIIAV
jgi:hypothetical protein